MLKNHMDKITVITVCYNAEKVLENTILSVVNQQYNELEYIVIDGKSTDGTLEIIKKYKDHIAQWLSEPDKGIYDAMNKGLKMATGKWVIFMNAGDGFVNPHVLKDFTTLISEDAMIAYGDVIMECEGYYYIQKMGKADVVSYQMPVNHQATLIRRSYHQANPFDISYKSSGDYNFFYQAYLRDHVKFQYIPLVLSYFDNREGMSKDNHIISMHENLRIWNKERDLPFRIKQEINLLRYRFVMFIKKYFYSSERKRMHEIRNLRKKGYEVHIK